MLFADLRKEYTQAKLDQADALSDPFDFFRVWFEQSQKVQAPEANAMTLSTVDSQGRPTARIVLLKGLDERGFVFFTNYESRKGMELHANPRACLLFYWPSLERQIRIEGVVEKVSAAESDAYFASRPLASRQGAVASHQSCVLASRDELEAEMVRVQEQFPDGPPRPAHWGGYRVCPDYFEFWQGRVSRLHDRLVYQRDASAAHAMWNLSRLAP